MSHLEFFEFLEDQFDKDFPFVAYRKPEESHLKALLQSTDALHQAINFSESGFICAPFDSEKQNVLIPSEISATITSDDFLETTLENKPTVNTEKDGVEDSARTKHLQLVEKGILAIKENRFKKVVLSRVKEVSISEEEPLVIFKSLLMMHPTAFVYCWYHPKVGLWLGATPETLLSTKGLSFKTMALAGTQLYQGTLDVEWDKKNLTEQKLVVNYIEEQLVSVAESVVVSEPKTTKAGQLLHIKSDISGRLKPDTNTLKQLVSSLHPTPAVCGLPKSEAKTFILENELYDREFYTGFLGELNLSKKISRNKNSRNVENNAYASIKKESHLFVNLRCMQLKDKKALIYVGGGITSASEPELEWDETVNKAQTMLGVFN
ncbi:chorismate-binding protein [Sediminibacter sp. Hel_I_10]|uniref:chorismate-binding protein n=1 Tax=Sediminibacter sp. Hel_I_10 TaxID=1392490 RepID=UPI00047AAA77|nr:chorismate-binding protein [Sediminibacter sp. Hel_I_10]